jgi:hypothetical protein
MRKGNGKIGDFMSWADSRYGGGRDAKPSSSNLASNPALPPPSTITYDIRNNRIFPDPYQQNDDVSQAKLRIAKAREENLALKRIIAEKSIQHNNHNPNSAPPVTGNQKSHSLPQSVNHQSDSQSDFHPSPPHHESIHSHHEEHQNRVKRNPSPVPIEATSQPSRSRPTSNHSLPKQTSSDSLIPPSDSEDLNSQSSKPPLHSSPSSSSSSLLPPKPKKKKKQKTSEQIQKKKLQKEKESQQRNLLEQSLTDLKRFSHHLDAAIDDNKKLLNGDLPILDSKLNLLDQNKMTEAEREQKKKLKMEEKQKRQKLKLQMDSLIRGQILNILPRWRHRLRGNWNPKPEEILKGKSLFRVGYLMVMYFYVKPRHAIQHRKAQTKSSEMDSFLKSLLLLIDNTGHWIGKLIKLPISSIIQVDSSALFF